MENLNTKVMLRNHKLAKSILDVSWFSFVTKLQYKADWYGRKIIKVDKGFPSSQSVRNADIRTARKLSTFENGLVLFFILISIEISMQVLITVIYS